MRKNIKYFMIALMAMVVMVSCNDDEANVEPAFSNPFSFNAFENISDTEVIGTVTVDGEPSGLTYEVLSNDGGLFEIDPESGELSLVSGMALNYEEKSVHEISVRVTDGDLSQAVGVTINVLDVTDDNVMAIFEVETQETFEELGGATVTINFDKPVLAEGATVKLSINQGGMVYNEDFTTEPNGESGALEIAVPLGARSVSFDLEIVNDAIEEGDETIVFTLEAGANDIIVPASAQTEMSFTVIDDDILETILAMVNVEYGAPLELWTINPKSGVVNDLEISIPYAGSIPRLFEYAPSTELIYTYTSSQVTDQTDYSTTTTHSISTVDMTNGLPEPIITLHQNYQPEGQRPQFVSTAGVGTVLDEGYIWGNYGALYAEESTLYVFGTMEDEEDRIPLPAFMTIDLNTNTITAAKLLTNGTGLDSIPRLSEVRGAGVLNDRFYVTMNGYPNDEASLFELDLSTGEVISVVEADMDAVLLSNLGATLEDGIRNTYGFDNGAIIFGDSDNNPRLSFYDSETNEITEKSLLEEFEGIADRIYFDYFPTANLPQ